MSGSLGRGSAGGTCAKRRKHVRKGFLALDKWKLSGKVKPVRQRVIVEAECAPSHTWKDKKGDAWISHSFSLPPKLQQDASEPLKMCHCILSSAML